MKTRMHRKFNGEGPYYLVLLACYPVLALLANNLGQIPIQAGLRALLVSLMGSALFFLVAWICLKNPVKAGLVTALFQLLFFTYGHVYFLLYEILIFGWHLGEHALLAPLWVALLILVSVKVVSQKSLPPAWEQALNLASATFFLMAASQVIYGQMRNLNSLSVTGLSPVSLLANTHTEPDLEKIGLRRDVYYIIMDGYTRADALKQDFSYDNEPFLQQLRQLGFVIPDCTQSNYGYTALSLSSSLHMDYLENFTSLPRSGESERNGIVYKDLIGHSPVRQNFSDLGYKMVAFDTGHWWADVNDADIYLVAADQLAEKARNLFNITGFEDMLLRTSLVRILFERNDIQEWETKEGFSITNQQHYQRVNQTMEELGVVSALIGPKYVYAHIMAPHYPFVFQPDGSYRFHENVPYSAGYRDEVEYLNRRLIEVVQTILANSTIPPIIVIQGDHGWESRNRMKILNAYYLPDGGDRKIYPEITPVNTFRVIFDTYFGGHYGLISDKSYLSWPDRIYNFTPEAGSCASASQ